MMFIFTRHEEAKPTRGSTRRPQEELQAMAMPAVTVLMPVYNADRYVAEAVRSILDQTFRDFEFLIIDDGSTDRSPEILAEYAGRDGRIRLLRRENRGLLATLNELIGLAQGEILARMDADDIAMPRRFERQLAFLRSHPEVVAVGSRAVMIDPDGDELFEMCDEQTHDEIDGANMRGKGGALLHPAVMMRAAAVRSVGGYRTEFHLSEDMDLWLRLAEVGQLHNIQEILLKYRQHVSSRGYVHQSAQDAYLLRALQDACRRRGLPIVAGGDSPTQPLRGEAEHHRKWAWWALGAGRVRAARKHALRTLRLRPFSFDSWRVAACALRGH
jgi:glycosyltransferase involved in cell wall biosynthesis